MLKPLNTNSLKDVFIKEFEKLILSGQFLIGEKLPSERDLAQKLGVSRPVVHEGILDLASKGLVTMKPRIGTVVNDYREEGSLAVLTSLFEYNEGVVEKNILSSLLDLRMLFETEIAKLAALNRTDDQIILFERIIEKEKNYNLLRIEEVIELDFAFHHLTAMATDNTIYHLLMNS